MKKYNCIICRRPLNNGIIVNGKVICELCEKRLIKLKVGTDFYDYYIKRIKERYI